MKILITGAKGFIGKNLIAELRNQGFTDLLEYDLASMAEDLDSYTRECEFVFHLAGINRPVNQEDYMTGNFGFTSLLLESLKKYNNKAPIVLTSSTQATLENPYGLSKKACEELITQYGETTGASVFIYRLPNVFGKWCLPHYNSAVATFCNNIANDLPVHIHDPNTELHLVYIDDVIHSFIDKLSPVIASPVIASDHCSDVIASLRSNPESPVIASLRSNPEFPVIASLRSNPEIVEPQYTKKLSEIVELLYQFKESRNSLQTPDMNDTFIKKLYSTYLSYLPKDRFNYPLKTNSNHQGSFTEFLKSTHSGQVSINISKPHSIKGNHWHHTKAEKFLVVSGKGVIRFRKAGTNEIIEYFVSGDKSEVVDIPAGYTHHIENLGETDLVTVIWASEVFDRENPDTFILKV